MAGSLWWESPLTFLVPTSGALWPSRFLTPWWVTALRGTSEHRCRGLPPASPPSMRPDPMSKFAISSGHGQHVGGASGYINEVQEARKIVDALAPALRSRGASVVTFHDNTSYDQSTNLETIVNFHNSQ